MSWRKIQLIYGREIRDQMRDRRTLFMIAILPLLLYPALGIGMVQMLVLFQEQPRTVVILGEEELPETPPLLKSPDDDESVPRRFVERWFASSGDAAKLEVFTESSLPEQGDEEADPRLIRLLADARTIRDKYRERERLAADPASGRDEIERAQDELAVLFASSQIQVLIVVPEGFAAHLADVDRLIRNRSLSPDGSPPTGELESGRRPIVIHNKADKKSQIAYNRVSEAMAAWEQAILRERLKMAHLPETLPTPVNAESVDLAKPDDISHSVWSVLFPALLIIMAVTGAFYPAIDLGAGEKERGTMETLLICPASRTEIVLGKFLTVMTFSSLTAVLNLLSMGLTGTYMMSLGAAGTLDRLANLTPPSLSALLWVLVLLVPLAALFSALSLSLATFARSSKEGQYYLTPLLMVTMGLTVFCLSPTIEITPFYSVMPIVGPALLLKELLAAPESSGPLVYAIPVLATSVIYSLLGLWWAIEQFAREDVLFREAERFELSLWLRHLLRDKEPTPSFAEAGVCFVLIVMVQFASFKFMQQQMLLAGDDGRRILQLQMVSVIVTIGCPALFMSILLTTNVLQTLRLRRPSWSMLAVGAVLPVMLHPLSVELLARLEWFFPELPRGAERILEAISDEAIPWWIPLLAVAVIPAICEELAFRGFILSGFSRSRRKWLPIVLSALAFGIIHMFPQQVLNAALLGLVLGLIVVHSRSLYPAVLFHFVYNSMQILRSRAGTDWVRETPAEWFFAAEGEVIRYQWPTLLLAAVVSIVLLRWLVNQAADGSSTVSEAAVDDPDRLRQPGLPEKSSLRV